MIGKYVGKKAVGTNLITIRELPEGTEEKHEKPVILASLRTEI
jgi:hypothetical protein